MSKFEMMRARATNAVMAQRKTVRDVVTAGEVLGGAFAGGYLAQSVPTVAGVPSDAAAGIVLLTGGFALKQKDATALGLGMLAGYLHDIGAQTAQNHPIGLG